MALSFQDKIRPKTQTATGVSFADKIRPIQKTPTTLNAMSDVPVIGQLSNFGIGVGSSLVRTAAGIPEAMSNLMGMGAGALGLKQLETAYKENAAKINKFKNETWKDPFQKSLDTTSGVAGEVVGNVAPYFIGAGAVNPATSGMSFIPKVLARTAPDIAISTAQSGADPKTMAATGVTSAVANAMFPGLAKPVASIKDFFKATGKSAGVGYVGDVASGMAGLRGEDREGGKAFIPGAGTVIGTGIGAIGAGKELFGNQRMQKYYQDIDRKNFKQPTLQKGPGYTKANSIYRDADDMGIKLEDEAADSLIQHDSIVSGSHYDTIDTADMIRADNGKIANDMLAPSFKYADMEIPPTSLDDIRDASIRSVMSDVRVANKEAEIKKIITRFNSQGKGSLRQQYPRGMKPSDLQKEKITHAGATNFANPDKDANYHISNGLRGILEEKIPVITDIETGATFSLKDFNSQLQKKYMLADYLEALNGKKVPVGIVQKMAGLGSKLIGAYLGNSLSGGLGGVVGYHAGGVMANTFAGMSNPMKRAYLNSIKQTQPKVYKVFMDYLKMKGENIYKTPALPAPQTAKEMIQETGVNTVPNRFDQTIELGYPNRPITEGQRAVNDFGQNTRILGNTKMLPAPAPRTIVPNTQGTPNQPGVDYGTPEIGGMRQRIFKGAKQVPTIPKVSFSNPVKDIHEFRNPQRKFMITTSDNPNGIRISDTLNDPKAVEFRKFLDDNGITYTKQEGNYGYVEKNSNIIEIDNPQQQKMVDNWLEANAPQSENILVKDGVAVRYDPRTKQAFKVKIDEEDLNLPEHRDEYYSNVNGKKYAFRLYTDDEIPMTAEELKKFYNK